MEDEKQVLTVGERIRRWVKKRRLWTVFFLLLAVAVGVVTYWAIWANSSPAWTGFGGYDEEAAGPRAKTLWDWLGLLIVPGALAAGVYWLNRSQKETELKIAEKAREKDREIAEQARVVDRETAENARTAEREIADNRQRQATLEAFYDRMTELLLEHGLRMSDPESEARSIARARTVAVVKSLDGERNRQLFAFLKASKLIDKESPIVALAGVDFGTADLHTADLRGIDLSGANLRKANLVWCNLSEANLSRANLDRANVGESLLSAADLTAANLPGTNLTGSDLSGATLSGATLNGATLYQANLTTANLSEADLGGSNLSGARLTGVDLTGANLGGVYLSWADLLRS